MALECRIVRDFAELEAISGAWDTLALSSGARSAVFQIWAWARAYWAARSETVRLHAPLVMESGRTVGIMPLVIEGQRLKWLTAPFADYSDILTSGERAVEVLAICCEELLRSPDWTNCVLQNVPDTSILLSASNRMPALLRKRITSVPRFRYSAVQENGSDVLDHMSRKRSFRQHENRLARQGKLQFRHIESHGEIALHLDSFFAMHIARSALAGRKSQFTSPQTQQLFRTLVTEMNPAGMLRFSVLEIDGSPLAYHLGFEQGGRLVCYVPTFHVDYWDFAPGEVLFRNLFKYASQKRLTEFDLTIGDEAYKSRLATLVGQTYTVWFDREIVAPRDAATRILRGAEKFVRERPRSLAIARKTLAGASRIRNGLREIRERMRGRLAVRPALVSLPVMTTRVAAGGTVVERMGLHAFGIYAAGRNIAITAATLQQIRDNLKRKRELYCVRVNCCEFLFWRSGDAVCEDLLSLRTPSLEFARAVTALLNFVGRQNTTLLTLRRGAMKRLSAAGLLVGECGPAQLSVSEIADQTAAAVEANA